VIINNPIKDKKVPKVDALVPAWIRLNKSGIRTKPNAPKKINMEPNNVKIAPIIPIVLSIIITPFPDNVKQ